MNKRNVSRSVDKRIKVLQKELDQLKKNYPATRARACVGVTREKQQWYQTYHELSSELVYLKHGEKRQTEIKEPLT